MTNAQRIERQACAVTVQSSWEFPHVWKGGSRLVVTIAAQLWQNLAVESDHSVEQKHEPMHTQSHKQLRNSFIRATIKTVRAGGNHSKSQVTIIGVWD